MLLLYFCQVTHGWVGALKICVNHLDMAKHVLGSRVFWQGSNSLWCLGHWLGREHVWVFSGKGQTIGLCHYHTAGMALYSLVLENWPHLLPGVASYPQAYKLQHCSVFPGILHGLLGTWGGGTGLEAGEEVKITEPPPSPINQWGVTTKSSGMAPAESILFPGTIRLTQSSVN